MNTFIHKKPVLLLWISLSLFMAGCDSQKPEALSDAPPIVAENGTTLKNETNTGNEASVENSTSPEAKKVFSFSEIGKNFGPGPFSVNDLSSVFGKPVKLHGGVYSMSSTDFALFAAFEGISFDLVTKDDKLSFVNSNNFDRVNNGGENNFPVTEQDKDVKIEPFSTTITGNQWNFVRSIKIGDTKEKVISAYGGYIGDVSEYEGKTTISYIYRPDVIEKSSEDERFDIDSQTGGVNYVFSNDKLIEIHVFWYDAYLAFD